METTWAVFAVTTAPVFAALWIRSTAYAIYEVEDTCSDATGRITRCRVYGLRLPIDYRQRSRDRFQSRPELALLEGRDLDSASDTSMHA